MAPRFLGHFLGKNHSLIGTLRDGAEASQDGVQIRRTLFRSFVHHRFDEIGQSCWVVGQERLEGWSFAFRVRMPAYPVEFASLLCERLGKQTFSQEDFVEHDPQSIDLSCSYSRIGVTTRLFREHFGGSIARICG